MASAPPDTAPGNGSSTSPLDLLELHDFAVSLGLKAGRYLRHEAASRSGLTGDRPAELSAAIKMSSVDIVTAADIEVGPAAFGGV
jgi:hypothetical protein